MPSASNVIRNALDKAKPVADGRRARSVASRIKIIEATVELVAAGDPDPSASAVAKKAGVGLRSVFRHFEDKDSIIHEIDDLLVAAYQPLLVAPYRSDDWRDQLHELVDRRCAISEAAAVFRISAIMQRYRSPFVREKYQRLHAGEKRMLDAVLPENLRTSTRVGRAILIACSFDSWRLLRQDEELTQKQAIAAIKQMVDDILESANLMPESDF